MKPHHSIPKGGQVFLGNPNQIIIIYQFLFGQKGPNLVSTLVVGSENLNFTEGEQDTVGGLNLESH